MNNYINYRYRDVQNQSFQNEFRSGSNNHADFVGSKLKSCNFRGTSLVGADFSEAAIGRDHKNFQKQITQMSLHIILGIPLGLAAWFSSQLVFVGCGGEVANPYGWLTNHFVWIAAFAAAATMSKRSLFYIYIGLIGFMIFGALIGSKTASVISIGVVLVAFGMSLFGLYVGYKKGAIAVGMVWMAVGVSSAISAGYSWIKLHEHYYAILFAVLTVVPAILATKAFNLHFAKFKMSAMTSFHEADLENARFVNADLENCDFLGANLQGVDWHGATFKNCKFSQGFAPKVQDAIAKNPETNPEAKQLAVNT